MRQVISGHTYTYDDETGYLLAVDGPLQATRYLLRYFRDFYPDYSNSDAMFVQMEASVSHDVYSRTFITIEDDFYKESVLVGEEAESRLVQGRPPIAYRLEKEAIAAPNA